MKRWMEKPDRLILVAVFFGIMGLASWHMGWVSSAQAHHKPGHTCNGAKCGPPPTVDELPIKYMVPGGMALILLTGGVVYLMRNRKKKTIQEA